MTAIFTAAEGDAKNSARLLQEEGPDAQTGGGGCRSLTTIVSTTARATRNICMLVTGTLGTNCLFCWALNQLGSGLVESVHIFMPPMAKGQQREAASEPTFRTTSLSPAMVPSPAQGSVQIQTKPNSLERKIALLWIIRNYKPNVRARTVAKKFKISLLLFTHFPQS